MAGAVDQARQRFGDARVARLATVGTEARPHVVPVVFALVEESIWMAVDGKPKSTRSLRRLADIRANPRVSLLVDRYDDDWSTLWWVRADGMATVQPPGADSEREGIRRLVAKYHQYQTDPPAGPVIHVAVDGWRSWAAAS